MARSIRRLLNWTGSRKRRIYIGFVYSVFHTLFTAMPVIIAAYGFKLILDDMQGKKTLATSSILVIAIAMAAAVAGRFLFGYFRASAQESAGYEVTAEQRLKIGERLKRAPLGFFNRTKTGDLTSAVTTDLSFIEMHGMKMIDVIVNGYISVFTMVLCLAFYHYAVALVALAGIILSAFCLKGLRGKSEKNAPFHQQAKDRMISATIEYIRGMPEVKAYHQQGAAQDGIHRAFAMSKKVNIQIEKNYMPFNSLHLFSLHAASVAIVALSAWLALNEALPLPTMIMMLIFSFVMFNQVEAMNNASHVLKVIDVTLDKLEELEETEDLDQGSQEVQLEAFDIEFANVSFGYDGRQVIRNVSFTVPEHTTTAIVGPSGSGKTTLCKLIARFYDADQGSIAIGGAPVREMAVESLLKHISIVFQKVYLFHDTILNNIRFGKPDAGFEEVVEAARKARCHEFIMALPDGYDTMIGEGGSTLSGGEKQRLSIARAMLKDAPIIILDEATASIDPEKEHEIQQAISALVAGRTILIIAHRLATIRHADQIIVLEHGAIAQKGTHEELSKQDGIYSKFLSIRQKAEGWRL
ncbi:ABC transporter ATP-binding protein [Paenibacillus senegalensis]|uniref:ABC transporter ATP-binding protein n=1 Tax=Paenibacillus senegalensis TaxID=1465766 RepID=UPI000289BD33|nr:ABC transporter ATP-binding protein [Paenibacillus senegalensis]